MDNELDAKTVAYLRRVGHSDKAISSFSKETRLFRDLGLDGDSAIEEFQILANEFGVNLTEFTFYHHFPSELSVDALLASLCSMFRLNRYLDSITAKYKPITLGMIQDAIAKGKMVTNR